MYINGKKILSLVGVDSNDARLATKEWVNNNKVSKSNETSSLYGTDNDGNQTTINYSKQNVSNCIVQRTANKEVLVPTTPTDNNAATSKSYVNNLIAGLFKSRVHMQDFNIEPTVENNGVYYYTFESANKPALAEWGIVLQLTPANDTGGGYRYAIQIAFGNFAVNGHNCAVRMYNPANTGAWEDWRYYD